MNDDALKKLWQQQAVDAPRIRDSDQIAAMKSRMQKFARMIARRDLRENIAAVIVAIVFSFYFIAVPGTLARVGSAVVVISSVFITIYSEWRKRRVPKARPDASMMDTLRAELQTVEVQIELLRSILWWYILPITVGVMLFKLGVERSLVDSIPYAVGVALLDLFIYWLNQRAVDRTLLPLQAELKALLSQEDRSPMPSPEKKNLMSKLLIIVVVIAACFAVAKAASKRSLPPLQSKDANAIGQMLTNISKAYDLPALSIAVVADGKLVATNAVGVRRYGGSEVVTVDDKFHIGSVTKSMTATIAAMLVEQRKISWTNTIGEILSTKVERMHADYKHVTLEQLLAHRGGVPGAPPNAAWRAAWKATGSPAEQRLAFIKDILAEAPAAAPGTKHIYSNQGYAIAGVMLEKASGETWEELLRALLFEPLEMKSAGFGAPCSLGKVDQPWGHQEGFGAPKPVPPGPGADNPLAISPAGAVHCSVEDLAKYAAFHLSGERGEGKLLKPETFQKLHKSMGDDYGLGWVVVERPWAKGTALMHNGSNTMFYVVVWIAPKRNFAVVVATNSGAQNTFNACDDAASQLIHQFLE